MSDQELSCRLKNDLDIIGLPINEVHMEIRPFSKTYFGNYFPLQNRHEGMAKIYIYPYMDKRSTYMYPYYEILRTAIHEMCHHVQYSSSTFKRKKGVMHDVEFWELYNKYVSRLKGDQSG